MSYHIHRYAPRRGSVPDRIIAWLHTQPAGKYKALAIATALQIDERAVVRSMQAAVAHRLVEKTVPVGRARPAYFQLAGVAAS